jgi:hypothetical protein
MTIIILMIIYVKIVGALVTAILKSIQHGVDHLVHPAENVIVLRVNVEKLKKR